MRQFCKTTSISKLGKPCAKFMALYCWARADIVENMVVPTCGSLDANIFYCPEESNF
jgi:hypothetical protein